MTTISSRLVRRWVASGCIASTLIAGCAPVDRFRAWRDSADTSYYQSFVTQIEFPDVSTAPSQGALQTVDPLALQNPSELPSFDLTLQDAIRLALESSDVLRNLGGTVVAAPQGSGTEYDPALTELNPLGGTQAALAASGKKRTLLRYLVEGLKICSFLDSGKRKETIRTRFRSGRRPVQRTH
jgi:hypothetical protein